MIIIEVNPLQTLPRQPPRSVLCRASEPNAADCQGKGLTSYCSALSTVAVFDCGLQKKEKEEKKSLPRAFNNYLPERVHKSAATGGLVNVHDSGRVGLGSVDSGADSGVIRRQLYDRA